MNTLGKHLLAAFHCFVAALFAVGGAIVADAVRSVDGPLWALVVIVALAMLFALIATRVSWRAGYEAGLREDPVAMHRGIESPSPN